MSTLSRAVYHILLALAGEDRHGYGIMADVLEHTDGGLRLWPGVLYGSLKQLADGGLVVEVAPPAGAPRDRMHRRYYRLTRPGRAALADETARLDRIVRTARARRVRLKG